MELFSIRIQRTFQLVSTVKIKFNREDPDNEARKFFTNSQEIKYILGKIKERNAFPRKVTMRASGTRYYFE